MRNIKLTIEYDGTNFNGWQIQVPSDRTVQGEIEKSLYEIFQKNIHLAGSGRTDSGAHALGQVANFKVSSKLTTDEILRALNAHLPEDVVILKSDEVSEKFHAQFSAKRKTYRYTILNRPQRCAQQREFTLHVPKKLNIRAMRQAARCLLGRHDFRSFMATDPAQRQALTKKDTVRTIDRLEILKKGDFLYIIIRANGFLYKMVRNITGTLIAIGKGKLPPTSMKQILAQKDRGAAAETAPAKGLCLLEVHYGNLR